ncbi:MAG TPA: tetratricopeptide repeat protein [Coleofasciculaceae cyanobacterium]|jgi:tetratricopeptide (TPR) repeat protein
MSFGFNPDRKAFALAGILLVLTLLVCTALAYDLKDNAIQHANQGRLLMERGQHAEAVEEFKAALRLNPATGMSGALYNNLGLAYKELGEYPLAYVSFQRALRIQPTYTLYYKNLIETYAAAGRLREVEQSLRSVVTLNPQDAEAWFLLGLLYQEEQNKKASRVCFSRFLKLQPASELARTAQSAL